MLTYRALGWTEPELQSLAPGTTIPVSDLLFRCQPRDEVVFVEICYDGCIDAGSDRSDFCERKRPPHSSHFLVALD